MILWMRLLAVIAWYMMVDIISLCSVVGRDEIDLRGLPRCHWWKLQYLTDSDDFCVDRMHWMIAINICSHIHIIFGGDGLVHHSRSHVRVMMPTQIARSYNLGEWELYYYYAQSKLDRFWSFLHPSVASIMILTTILYKWYHMRCVAVGTML